MPLASFLDLLGNQGKSSDQGNPKYYPRQVKVNSRRSCCSADTKHNELCYRLNLTFDFALALRQSHLGREKYSLGEGCAALVEYSWTRACHNALVVCAGVCAGTRFGPEFGVGPWNGNPQALVGARWLTIEQQAENC